jgi:hypothetical protein
LRAALRQRLAAAFEQWGRTVTRHPYRIGLGALFVCLSLCLGLLALAPENRSYYLWVPTTSRSYVEWQYIERTFGVEGHGLVLYAEATDATGGNIFTYEALDELMKLHEFTMNLETTRSDGAVVRFKDACKRLDQAEECDTPNILQLWGFSRHNLRRDRASILNAISRLHVVSSIEAFAANVRYDERDSTRVESAQAIVLVYMLNGQDGAAYDIQPAWNTHVASAADAKLLTVSHYSNRSFDDEVARLVLGDIPLFASGMVITTCFIAATLGSMRSLVRSRVLLGMFAVVNVLLAVGAGFGLASAIGVPFTAISALLPLIVLGVTVDSVIIFVDHLDAEDESQSLETRFGRALSKSGPAVLVTALTTIAALATSTSTAMPAVAMFSSFGTLSFTMSVCIIFTFFLSLLVLDERRLQAGCISFAPCFTLAHIARTVATGAATPSHQAGRVSFATCVMPALAAQAPATTVVAPLPQEAAPAQHAKRARARAAELSPVQRFLRDRFAPVLLSPACSAVVVLAFAGLAVLSAIAIPRIQIGLPQSDVLPDDSYVRDALRAEELFGGKISSAQVVVSAADYGDADVSARYRRAHANVARIGFVKLTPPYWLEAYDGYLASRGLRADPFTSELHGFLHDERFTRFQDDVACERKERCASPAAARFRVIHSDGLGLAIEKLRLRDAMQTAVTNAGVVAPIVFQEGYLLAESDAEIWSLTWTNMVFALAAIFGIVLVFNETLPAIWITVCVALIDIDLLGVIWMVGLKLNAVTYVNLVRARVCAARVLRRASLRPYATVHNQAREWDAHVHTRAALRARFAHSSPAPCPRGCIGAGDGCRALCRLLRAYRARFCRGACARGRSRGGGRARAATRLGYRRAHDDGLVRDQGRLHNHSRSPRDRIRVVGRLSYLLHDDQLHCVARPDARSDPHARAADIRHHAAAFLVQTTIVSPPPLDSSKSQLARTDTTPRTDTNSSSPRRLLVAPARGALLFVGLGPRALQLALGLLLTCLGALGRLGFLRVGSGEVDITVAIHSIELQHETLLRGLSHRRRCGPLARCNRDREQL